MSDIRFSIIIPVYNRPDELKELLESLAKQSYRNFEVIVVEDGSTNKADEVAGSFTNKLDLRYFYKENSGQGFSRNFGFDLAQGDYFLVFDSDCIIPSHYLETVNTCLQKNYLDAYGGPDRAHPEFNDTQKAISYSMTSFFTTGGIRGNKKRVGQFHPRSFNMGISREVYQKTKGYIITRMAEDLEFSVRIIRSGFKVGLIEDAYVFHKRRTNLKQFFKQIHFFGRARINLYRFFPEELKPIHFFPALFVGFCAFTLVSPFVHFCLFLLCISCLLLYSSLILIDSTVKNKSIKVGMLSVAAVFTQLFAYGVGFLTELKREIFKRKK